MKRFALVLTFCLLFLYGFTGLKSPSAAITHDVTEINFPTSLIFKLDLDSAENIARVKLHYGTNRDTCATVSALAYPEFTTGSSTSARWEWDMRQSGGEPPGARIWWQWELIDNRGNSEMSERKEITWLDDSHAWKLQEEGLIRLHYYESDPTYGSALKDAAVSALNRLGDDIGMLPDQPVDLYIYSSTQDMRDAVFYEPGWTGGLAYSEYNSLIIGIDPADLEWGKNTEAHELTHVLVGDYTFSCLGSTPTWLSEGLAVYGEGGPNSDESDFFTQNVNSDTLLSFKVLSGGFSEDPNLADLSYSQSYYMVDYLIKTYGKDKMLGLLQTIKAGDDISDALKTTYGFDLAGFQNEWRASYALPAAKDSAQFQNINPVLIPTIIPYQGGDSSVNALTPTPAAAKVVSGDLFSSLKNWISNHLLLILVLVLVGCLLLIVIMLLVRQKGEK